MRSWFNTFFGLSKKDYLIRSLDLSLNYFDGKMNNLDFWNQCCHSDISTKENIKRLKNKFQNICEILPSYNYKLQKVINNPIVTSHYINPQNIILYFYLQQI